MKYSTEFRTTIQEWRNLQEGEVEGIPNNVIPFPGRGENPPPESSSAFIERLKEILQKLIVFGEHKIKDDVEKQELSQIINIFHDLLNEEQGGGDEFDAGADNIPAYPENQDIPNPDGFQF